MILVILEEFLGMQEKIQAIIKNNTYYWAQEPELQFCLHLA